jgi:hypothetical protein
MYQEAWLLILTLSCGHFPVVMVLNCPFFLFPGSYKNDYLQFHRRFFWSSKIKTYFCSAGIICTTAFLMVGQQFKWNLPYQREIGDFKKLAQHLNVRFAAMLVANCLCLKSKHAYTVFGTKISRWKFTENSGILSFWFKSFVIIFLRPFRDKTCRVSFQSKEYSRLNFLRMGSG